MVERLGGPVWVDGGKMDEVLFAKDFLTGRNLVYAEGAFFDEEGRLADENMLRKEIYEALRDYVSSSVPRKVDNILGVMRMECGRRNLPVQEAAIHVANGTYTLKDGFRQERFVCRNRLPVSYRPNCPEPERWHAFLEELLEEEDILTLQEYMGYCLLPVTIGQKMLIITGRGGEGKSRIGVVMKAMLGDNASLGSIAKVETNPFARADLEHKLLFIDDDLRLEALPSTNHIKSIITAELPMDLEKKGTQSYQGMLYCRFLAFGNGSLQAVNDQSYGFFRRQILLTAKPRNPNRRDDPYLGRRLKEEIDGIFLWSLAGLYRLIGNDFRFTVSDRARENMNQAIGEGNNVTQFMQSEGYFVFDKEACVTSRRLHDAYRDWCEDNGFEALTIVKFSRYLRQDASFYGLRYDNNVPIGGGKKARGFRGIRIRGV